MTDRLTKFNAEKGEYEYREVAKTQGEFAAQRKAVIQRLGEFEDRAEGRWIDMPTGAYGRMQSWCSACGKHSGIGGIESNRHKLYCPNCGAKMKGENNEQR
jgi:hypothetical protein